MLYVMSNTMDLFIHKDFFHLPFHLKLVGNKLQKTDQITGLAIGTKEFDEFAKLYLLDIPQFPPENFLKTYRSLAKFTGIHSVPWNWCMPQEFFINFIKDFGEKLYEQIKDLDTSYYEKYYNIGNSIYNVLQPAKINVSLFQKHEEDAIVKTFIPDEEGFAEVPTYSRVETVSGRAKVMSGANILHLNKEYREIIESRFGNEGAVYYLDFKSLEPRLTLALKLKSGTLPLDIYEDIKKGIDNKLDVSRAQIKIATISELYGSGLDSLKKEIPELPEGDLLAFAGMIHDYFGVSALKERIVNEYETNNRKYIKNLFGRYVSTTGIGSYALPNRFIQSSCVDIAQIGFSNIADYIKEMNWQEFIVPIFVLHDALLVDIHKNYFETVPTLCKIGAIDIPLLEEFSFYLKAERLSQ